MIPACFRTPLSFRRRAGFTLLEVLLAVSIFSVSITALYGGFRIASRAFSSGRQSAETLQTLRFVMDQITRDLRGIRFEEKYGRQFMAIETAILANQDLVIRNQQAGEPIRIPGILEVASEEDNATYVGLKGNFRFLGEGGDQSDSIEFTRRMPAEGNLDDRFLGAERVRYFVANHNLYRQRSRAFEIMQLNPDLWQELIRAREAAESARADARSRNLPYVDYWRLRAQGVLPPQIEPPYPIAFFQAAPTPPYPAELVARNVVEFRLSYGRYRQGSWSEVQTWDSDSKEHRSPEFRMPLDDPLFVTRLATYQEIPVDNLPSYVRIQIKIDPAIEQARGRKKRESAAAAVESTVWIPAARETYMPRQQDLFEPTPPESIDSNPGRKQRS